MNVNKSHEAYECIQHSCNTSCMNVHECCTNENKRMLSWMWTRVTKRTNAYRNGYECIHECAHTRRSSFSLTVSVCTGEVARSSKIRECVSGTPLMCVWAEQHFFVMWSCDSASIPTSRPITIKCRWLDTNYKESYVIGGRSNWGEESHTII